MEEGEGTTALVREIVLNDVVKGVVVLHHEVEARSGVALSMLMGWSMLRRREWL